MDYWVWQSDRPENPWAAGWLPRIAPRTGNATPFPAPRRILPPASSDRRAVAEGCRRRRGEEAQGGDLSRGVAAVGASKKPCRGGMSLAKKGTPGQGLNKGGDG